MVHWCPHRDKRLRRSLANHVLTSDSYKQGDTRFQVREGYCATSVGSDCVHVAAAGSGSPTAA